MKLQNYQVIFNSRPGPDGVPKKENFCYESTSYPGDPSDGQILVQNIYLSVDPAQRCQMNEITGVDYLSPWQLGEPVMGLGGVGVVIDSAHSSFKSGDIVMSGIFYWPWQLFFVIDVDKVVKVDRKVVGERLSLPISCLGLVGLTALFGITEKSQLHKLPVDGSVRRTVVISAAAGACGHLAGQIARLEGADYVIGICGSDEKCHFLTSRVGFDAAINYRRESINERLSALCGVTGGVTGGGVHCYFDNTGGEISEAVISHICEGGSIVLCGQISKYNTSTEYPPPLSPSTAALILERQITRDRFLVLQFQHKFDAGVAKLTHWVHSGALKVFETIQEGLENAGCAFCSMMAGGNIGKQLVSVTDPASLPLQH